MLQLIVFPGCYSDADCKNGEHCEDKKCEKYCPFPTLEANYGGKFVLSGIIV